MRRVLCLAVLAAATGCGRGEPKVPRAVAADAENHGFALDLSNGRVLFIQGSYPRKSYFCWATLDGRKQDCRRLKGYALQRVERVFDDGSSLVEAKPVEGGGGPVLLKLGPKGRGKPEPVEPAPEPLARLERWPEETAKLGPNYRFSVVPDPKPQPMARQSWLRPRLLWKTPVSGAGRREEIAWTKRQGEILAVDEDMNRMFFAVTDRDAAALWILPLDLKGLAAAVPAIDGASPVARVAGLGLLWLAAIVIGTGSSMAAWFFIRRR